MENKKKSNLLISFIFFVLLIALTFKILLGDENVFHIFKILKSVKIQFVVIGIFSMFLYLVLEAVNMGRTLKKLGESSTFFRNIKYSFIGFFFSSITPAASGGQPMQIYYMYRDKISVANSTLALLINLSSMQVITISFALISLLFNYQYLNAVLIICFIVGILLNSSALALLIIGIFSKKLSAGLIGFALKVLKFFRVKNLDDKKEKFEKELEKYQSSALYIKENKKMIIKILFTTLIQFTIYYSITYWVYRALDFNKYNIIQIITMQSVLFATVSGIPSPGAVGVSEGAFTEIFRNVYPKNIMSSAVLLNRGINFYLYVLICAIVTIINHFVKRTPKNFTKGEVV
ncbi:MAG: YbhN family protein [Clostridia bacterium]